MGKIKDLNLRDKEFVRRWRELYNSMLNDGYTELNAIRFSEIAALYNSEGIRTCSNFVGEHDSIVITGIQNYVVDYIKYIANSPNHGYDQMERWAGNNDFDCATLIISGYDKAFIDLRHTITHMRFDDNPVAYSAVGAAALANNDLSAYGFVSHFPNQDFGAEDLVPKTEKENSFDYDVIVATPDMMPEIGKIGRLLGPKGLMPNPKSGTVAVDIKKAIKEIKAGKVEYRVDKDGNINLSVARASFDEKKIAENLQALCDAIVRSRPVSVKGKYIANAAIHTTMGPSIHITFEGRDL